MHRSLEQIEVVTVEASPKNWYLVNGTVSPRLRIRWSSLLHGLVTYSTPQGLAILKFFCNKIKKFYLNFLIFQSLFGDISHGKLNFIFSFLIDSYHQKVTEKSKFFLIVLQKNFKIGNPPGFEYGTNPWRSELQRIRSLGDILPFTHTQFFGDASIWY